MRVHRIRIRWREDRQRWYCYWYQDGRQRAESFPTKDLAEIAKLKLHHQLNSALHAGPVAVPWEDAVQEYLRRYDIEGLAPRSKYEAERALKQFQAFQFPSRTTSVSQGMVDDYIIHRRKQVGSAYTINKDISRLRTFLDWCRDRNYHAGGIRLKNQKTPATIAYGLTNDQICTLFARCPSDAWRVRLLIHLTTGLRRNDVDALPRHALNLDELCLDTTSQKTGKAFSRRPLPDAALPLLKRYTAALDGSTRLFVDGNARKVWESIRGDMTLQDGSAVTRQALRRTFSNLIQQTSSRKVAQKMLEHSDERTTREFYTQDEAVMRVYINELPVREWLGESK